MLTFKEVHEVGRDVSIGANDTAVTRWTGGPRWTRGTLMHPEVCPGSTFTLVLLQQALVWMVEKIRVIENSGWNVGLTGTELTLDVVSDSPGNGGVVHGLIDPAQVALSVLRAAM